MLRSLVPADYLSLFNGASGTVAIFACLNHMDVAGRACAGEGPAHLPACVDSPWLWLAFALLPLALLADIGDGWLARKTHKQSRYGGDLDSLADVISFGLAPAVLAFTLGLRGLGDAVVLVLFVACGIARLARFNATAADLATASGKVSHFEGTPIPSSLGLVLLLFIAWRSGAVGDALWGGELRLGPLVLHPLVLAWGLNGALMISTVRIPKP